MIFFLPIRPVLVVPCFFAFWGWVVWVGVSGSLRRRGIFIDVHLNAVDCESSAIHHVGPFRQLDADSVCRCSSGWVKISIVHVAEDLFSGLAPWRRFETARRFGAWLNRCGVRYFAACRIIGGHHRTVGAHFRCPS